MIFHENRLLADDSHEYQTLSFSKIGKDVAKFVVCCNVIGALRIKPSSKNFFTNCSKVVLLLWILFVIMFCVCHAFVSIHCSLVITAGKGLTSRLSCVCLFLSFGTFPCGVQCQVWYLMYRLLIFAFFLTFIVKGKMEFNALSRI